MNLFMIRAQLRDPNIGDDQHAMTLPGKFIDERKVNKNRQC
jgi:hypothetical protein